MSRFAAGTLTFLITDVESSSTLWERYPDAMRDALVCYGDILRSAIESHGGQVFKTVGDSFYSVFTSAPEALRAALAAQRALRDETWGETGPLHTRMSLHTGDSFEREDDYNGPTLNRTDRLRKSAHGGQVVMSSATHDLVRGCLPESVTLRDLGERRLTAMSQPERIFQLVAPDLPSEFPPLLTLDARLMSVPVPGTSFVGRKGELALVCDLMRHRDVRLVTLTGPAGTGKTRLSLQVVAELVDDYENGICFVDLSPLTDPAMVIAAIAQVLGIKESSRHTLAQAVQEYLQGRAILLVLDNFEHVIPAAPIVDELLRAAPRLKVLVTSREILKLHGEREYRVPPLTLPDVKRLPGCDRLLEMASIALFVERAQAARPDFALTPENAPTVAQICFKLDGLPLAIELVAARIRLLSPQEMLSRLSNRLGLLTGGGRDLPARQQTLRGAIDWSYDLLDSQERILFGRLGVFVGGCTVSAVEAVCNADGGLRLNIGDGLSSLVEKSLIQKKEYLADGSRYMMLATLQEYALEQLTEFDAAEAILRRHAEYYRALAEEAQPVLIGPTQVEWLDRLEVEHGNLRAAMQWSLLRGYTETALRISGALWKFWQVRGYLSEGRSWLEKALTVAECDELSPSLSVQSIYGAGVLAYEQGDIGRAATCFEASLKLQRETGDKRGIAQSLNTVANVAFVQGDYVRAMAVYAESRLIWQELDDLPGLAMCLNNLGLLAHYQGDDERARLFYEESLALSRSTGDRRGQALCFNNLGDVARAQQDLARADALYAESFKLWRELGDKRGMTSSLNNLAELAHDQDDVERMIALYRESLALCYELSESKEITTCLDGLADAYSRRNQSQLAAQLLGASDALRESRGIVMPHQYRADYERIVAEVRASLEMQAFISYWNQGRVMPPDRVIALAFDNSGASESRR